jgi:hypothetical protein
MEPYFQRGEIYCGSSAAFGEFKTQYQQFPRAQRLDVMDVLGYWPRLMRKSGAASLTASARQEQERAA